MRSASGAERSNGGFKVRKKASWTTSAGFADFYVGILRGISNLALWGDHLYLAINSGVPDNGWIIKLEK